MSGLPDFTFADLDGLVGQDTTSQQDTSKQEEAERHQETAPKEEVKEPEIKQDLEFEKKVQEQVKQPVMLPGEEPETKGDERYKALYNFWKEEGLISHDGEFAGTKEEFGEILRQQRIAEQEAIQEAVIGAVPDYAQSLVEYILTEGDQLSLSKLQEYLGAASKAEAVPQISTEVQAKSFLLQEYEEILGEKGLAEKFVETLEDDGELLVRAQARREEKLAKKQEFETQKVEESKAQKAARLQAQQQFQQSLAKELEGSGWKQDVQREVYNEIFSQSLRAKTSSIVQHPKALIKLANYLRYYNSDTGDIDEKAFANVAYSSAAKELKDRIEKHFGRSDAFGDSRIEESKRPSRENVQYEFVD